MALHDCKAHLFNIQKLKYLYLAQNFSYCYTFSKNSLKTSKNLHIGTNDFNFHQTLQVISKV